VVKFPKGPPPWKKGGTLLPRIKGNKKNKFGTKLLMGRTPLCPKFPIIGAFKG